MAEHTPGIEPCKRCGGTGELYALGFCGVISQPCPRCNRGAHDWLLEACRGLLASKRTRPASIPIIIMCNFCSGEWDRGQREEHTDTCPVAMMQKAVALAEG